MDEDKFQEFFDHFDINRDNIISIKEVINEQISFQFIKVITPYLDKVKDYTQGEKRPFSFEGLEHNTEYLEKIKKKGFEVG